MDAQAVLGGGTPTPEERRQSAEMDLIVAKSLALVSFFLIPVLLGMFSLYLFNKYRAKVHLISFLNCFSGGFFLGTSLLPVLGQGLAKFEEYRHLVDLNYRFPFFEVGIGVGFFIVALIEKLTHLALGARHRRRDQADQDDDERAGILETSPETKRDYSDSTNNATADKEAYDNPEHLYEPIDGGEQTGSVQGPEPSQTAGIENRNETGSIREFPNQAIADKNNSAYINAPNSSGESPNDDDAAGGDDDEGRRLSLLRVLLLLLALSLHTVFDGLAVGLQDDVTQVITLLLVFGFHKAIMALVVGVELGSVFVNTDQTGCLKGLKCGCLKGLKPFLALLLFSVASPLGVAIGMGITSGHMSHASQLLCGAVLQAIATGVFLYITCFELLAQDLVNAKDKGLLRLATAVLGFVIITVIETAVA